MRPLLLSAILGGALTGCYAEGNSVGFGVGDSETFLTLARCQREATATYAGGGLRYYGYECRGKVLGFVTEKRTYSDGKLTSQTK